MRVRFLQNVRWGWLGVAAVVLTLAGAAALGPGGDSPVPLQAAQPSPPSPSTAPPPSGSPAGWNPYSIADVAQAVSPAVVYVEARFPAPSQRGMESPFPGFPFGPFPWDGQGDAPVRSGTGFIIDERGYILTNQHVVGNPGERQRITVALTTDQFKGTVEAKLVGADAMLDLAVLKIEKPRQLQHLPVVPIGDSDQARVGEWVVAIGNPYGESLDHTVTVGVLSAKGRQIQVPDPQERAVRSYDNLMQTDAAINPGNSGGPLLNARGEVIGINTAVRADAQGIGFAIPINTAMEVLEELITKGRIVRPFLGVVLAPITPAVADYFGLPDTKGALVQSVLPDSAADKAGLRQYDVIVELDRRPVDGPDALIRAISRHKVGDKVTLLVRRRGELVVIEATLQERPQNTR